MEQKVKKYIQDHDLIRPKEKILIALSGGADSVALFLVLASLREELRFDICAAHLNHMLRGEESAADAVFVRSLCDSMDVACQMEAIAVQEEIGAENLEEKARQVRYDFLRRAGRVFRADKIATAHHANDQAETLLLHLVRGAGLEGLAAIAPEENDLIRPFLSVSREEILAFLADRGIAYRTDASNLSDAYRRNHMRQYLLPFLKQYNPQVVTALNHTAAICREDNAFLDELAKKEFPRLVKKTGSGCEIKWQEWQALPVSLQRRIFKNAFWLAKGEPLWLGYEHLEKASHLKMGAEIALPGRLFAWRKPDALYIGRLRLPLEIWPQDRYPLPVPGEVLLPAFSLQARAWIAPAPASPLPQTGDTVVLPLPYRDELFFRSRCPGDVFAPYGMQGKKKLKEFFIDEKVPLALRSRIPLLVAGEELLWIPGYRHSQSIGISPGEMIWVKLHKIYLC